MSRLVGDEVEVMEGIPVTSVARTLVDLAGVLDLRRLEQAVNEAEVRALRSRTSVVELLDRRPNRRGARALRSLVCAPSRGITRNELERRFLSLVEDNRLPPPRRNADLALDGRFVNVDFLWAAQRVIGELDGRAVHGTDLAFEGDRRRDRQLVAAGWRVARVTWAQLRDEPQAIAADLRELLGASTLSG
jgi:very-short-patch-repair endonuclease